MLPPPCFPVCSWDESQTSSSSKISQSDKYFTALITFVKTVFLAELKLEFLLRGSFVIRRLDDLRHAWRGFWVSRRAKPSVKPWLVRCQSTSADESERVQTCQADGSCRGPCWVAAEMLTEQDDSCSQTHHSCSSLFWLHSLCKVLWFIKASPLSSLRLIPPKCAELASCSL